MNVYYNPEDYGLEIVRSVNVADGWDFDLLVVWVSLDGSRLYYAHDSGCSCPTPFDGMTLASGLKGISTEEDLSAFVTAAQNHRPYRWDRDWLPCEWHPDSLDLYIKVASLFKQQGHKGTVQRL